DGIRDRNVTGVQTCALPILHPTHAAATRHRRRLLLLLLLHHDALGREQQRGDGRRVLQGGARDLGGVDDARRDEILEAVGLGVEIGRASCRGGGGGWAWGAG